MNKNEESLRLWVSAHQSTLDEDTMMMALDAADEIERLRVENELLKTVTCEHYSPEKCGCVCDKRGEG